MLFPTIEFTLFFLIFIVFLSLKKITSTKKILIFCLFNFLFYSFYSLGAIVYLLFWSFSLYLYPKLKFKKLLLITTLAVIQIAFWKIYETGLLGHFDWKMPLGISFFTFQGLTYIFALEKIPKHKPELFIENSWNFFKIFAFTGFFPTVFSGPILRAKSWDIEINKELQPNLINLNNGLLLIGIGLIYKLILASYLNPISKQYFSAPNDEATLNLWIGMYAYSLEIFFDFAGYSLLAIGICKLFNFNISNNFNQPYLSLNLKDFWTRWHISLSSWFKDYIYFSLGGKTNNKYRNIFNISVVMTISGLWHGLSGNYLFWGLLHTIGIVFNNLVKFKIPKIISNFLTIHYVFFAWIFFKSNTFLDGINYILNMFTLKPDTSDISFLIFFLLFVSVFFIYFEKYILNFQLKILNTHLKTIGFWSFIFILILIIAPSGLPPFIYFQY